MKKIFLLLILSCTINPLLFGVLAIQKQSLLHNTLKIYSQSGEEGVIDEILRRIGIQDGLFIEFGAADGIYFSNTRFLADKGWPGIFIESDPHLASKLKANCAAYPQVVCLKETVIPENSTATGQTIDAIASSYFPGQDIDVLSIDVDGLDYLIFESMKILPKVICIESSGCWHPLLDQRVTEQTAGQNLGQPLPVIIEIARRKGYEPVCFLLVNLFLVRKDYYSKFSDIYNDPVNLWYDSWNYIGEKQPFDQRYLFNRRADEALIKLIDPYPTPPLTSKRIY